MLSVVERNKNFTIGTLIASRFLEVLRVLAFYARAFISRRNWRPLAVYRHRVNPLLITLRIFQLQFDLGNTFRICDVTNGVHAIDVIILTS